MTRWRRGKGGGGGGGGYREGWWMSGGLDGLWVGARRPPPRQTSKKGAIERNRSASFTNVQTKRTDEEVEEEKSRQRVDPFASSPFDSSGQNKRKKGVFFPFFFLSEKCVRGSFSFVQTRRNDNGNKKVVVVRCCCCCCCVEVDGRGRRGRGWGRGWGFQGRQPSARSTLVDQPVEDPSFRNDDINRTPNPAPGGGRNYVIRNYVIRNYAIIRQEPRGWGRRTSGQRSRTRQTATRQKKKIS